MGTIQRKIGSSVERKTAAFTAVPGGYYLCNTTGGTFTATLPSGTAQDMITFSDDARTWGTINLTIAPASGETIDGLAVNESLICDLTGAFVTLTWNGTTWTIATNGFASSVSNGSLSSGSGSGSKNYILNTNSSVNWAASDAGITVSDETVAANIPDNSTQTTAIKVLRASGTTSYARYRFVLDQADYGKKFQLSFDMKYAGAAGDYKLEIYSFTTNAYTGGTFISPQTTDIPALSVGGTFTTTVDMPGSAAPYIEFRVRGNGVSTPLYLNSVYAGPGVITQGAAVSDWVSYTPSWTSDGTQPALGNGSLVGSYRRVGDTVEVEIDLTMGSTTTFGTSFYKFGLPSGLSVNTSQLVGNGKLLGVAQAYSSATTGNTCSAFLNTAAANDVYIVSSSGGLVTNLVPFTFAAGHRIKIQMKYAVNEWAGNGTVNLGPGAQVEYAATSGTWNADSSTTVYGPAGQLMGGALATGRIKTITWQYPIQQDDQIVVEGSRDGVTWAPLNGFSYSAGQVIPTLNSASSAASGVCYYNTSTQTVVVFNQYLNMANDDSPVTDWPSSNAYWRVRKSKASAPVGFSKASYANGFGLVAPRKGQYSMTVSGSVALTSYRAVGIYYQDQDGNHRLKFNITSTCASGSRTGNQLTITGVTFKNVTDHYQAVAAFNGASTAAAANAYVNPGNGIITVEHPTTTTGRYCVSGDVELESAPSWV